MKSDAHPLRSMIVLFTVLSLLFSAVPFVLSLLLDKSGMGLAYFTIWYALLPPLFIFLLSLFLHKGESNIYTMTGKVWMSLGLWFAVQLILGLASGLHILVKLLAFPSVSAGGKGFILGALLFLGGGYALYRVGLKRPAAGARSFSSISLAAIAVVIFVLLPLLVAGGTSAGKGAVIEDSRVPSQNAIFSWIEDVYNLGVRRPGSAADLHAIDYLENKLREFGIADVRLEPFTFDYWEPLQWRLSVKGASGGERHITTFYVPYSKPTGNEGMSAEMLYVGAGAEADLEKADVKGKILLVDLPAVNISWDKMKIFSYFAYDPDGSTKGWEHPYPIGWMFKYEAVYERAKEHGAAGIVGILQGYPDMGEFTYYAPYDGIFRTIPSLYVMERDGEKLKSMFKEGKLQAKILLAAKTAMKGGKTATVYGVLPGKSRTALFIHSHHDAPWQSGIEDSSGVGMVLSLAKYFAQVPPEKRERTLVFAFTGSHMVGAKANYAFAEKHKDGVMKDVLYDICLEHISDDYNPPNPPTGNPEPRGVFITESPVTASLFASLTARHGIQRLLLFPTGTPLGVPTDAQPFHNSGYNVISLISGPSWLFDDDDTLDRVDRKQLVPVTRLYIDLIEQMGVKRDWMLTFNLNLAVIGLIVLVLTPLAAAGRSGKK